MAPDKPLIITAGEPAGIGPEICLALAREALPCRFVVVSDPEMLRSRARMAGMDVSIKETSAEDAASMQTKSGELHVIATRFPEPPECGRPRTANAQTLLDGLKLAVDGCMNGRFAGLVTAPLHKSVINDAGIAFTGHTEFLAECTGTQLAVMLLVAGDLRVALASTHLPLREVPDYLTQERIRNVLQILFDDLKSRFGIATPRIVVCGLNPHAGEAGHLGAEDAAIIAPVVDEFAARGYSIRGPVPADTAFTPAAGQKDAVLAMYHDQGLPVLKYAGFGRAVNVTLGLPIIRTSVDHGTALDIAGTGEADAGSLFEAVRLAAKMAQQ
ncbi:MAG: 4-hydroxythreonine-4-phosphate dehydrogenase PdxA [Gammaproteobacteria bacterium]|nr:4-hydroxythreonine-4-phosphate dehydrogenase PdxA [Gammaproteobacteria bacterium]MDH3373007.1 4-hydroxythreonine-4-phosphate dehydrogenase PdxA [Gammaproteobacteria bacterium]MDH3408149.1 4-hydroxythreonine-4-phosphate dehydrogenase PdxA [Gammaproteobacteria bacterium]MDH3552442.1 4-hydroxythreonine-4-phosphate dehydrogenase PdxA [Gammaproteobacteria bacterium]